MADSRCTRLPLTRGLFALLAIATACESTRLPGSPEQVDVPADLLRSQHARVALGQTQAEVAESMGSLPVRRPGHPDAPFPTPLHVAEWTAPSGERVRLEVYVIATRLADGCPDVVYDDAPVAFAGGRVVAIRWDEVEWRWREWGGELAGLRALQDRVAECEPQVVPEPEPPAD